MSGGSLFSYFLTNLMLSEQADEKGSYDEHYEEGGYSSQGCPDRYIAKDIEEEIVLPEWDEQPV